ncbi:MAG: hypothetical protein K2X50_09865 [Gammaproteobacteria bacterium]|nr:hypothetical protein [Gammaproteobacteria bacterium]
MEQLSRSQEFKSNPKAVQLPSIDLVTQNDQNYLGLDTRNIDPTFSGWLGSFFSKKAKNDLVRYTFWNLFSKPATWLASDTSKRTEIKRRAYEEFSQYDGDIEVSIPRMNYRTTVRDILTSLSTNTIEQLRADHISSPNEAVEKLIRKYTAELQQEDHRVVNEFARTLSDAAPNGMVGTFIQGRRNPHLSQILSNFTLLYINSPEKNPLLHASKLEENPTDFLRRHTAHDTPWPILDRRAVDGYMARIQSEITKLINMPPEALGMPFSEKHKTVDKVLKRAFNRLAAEIDYGFRFENRLNGFGYEVCPAPDSLDNMESGKLYYNAENYSILDSANNPVTVPHHLDSVEIDHADFPKFKADLLSLAAKNGHVFAEKSNDYAHEKTQRNTDADHKKLESKLSMRSTKKVLFWTAAIFAIIIAAGQVAIAVFATTGSLAVAIGIACAVTNTILFWRDIAGVMISLVRGDLAYGLSWRLKVFLGVFFSFSLAIGIVNGGFAFSALIPLTGFTLATAPAIALIGTGFIALITIVGMTSMFFMPGVGFAKALRGKTVGQLFSEGWKSVYGFIFDFPEYNHDIVKLQDDVIKLMASNDREVHDYEVHKEISQKRWQITLLKFQHNLRHILKVAFAFVLVPAAIVGTGIAAYAFSKSAVEGTRNLIQLTLKWSAATSLAVASFLSWVPTLVGNLVLTAKNLTGVSLLLGTKVAQIPAAIFYGIGMAGVILTSGRGTRTISESVKYYRDNFTKEIVLPGSRIILGLGVLVLIVLNGYGNGSTLGQQGAFSLEWLPTRMLAWLEKMAPATMETLNNSFGIVTAVVGTSSSIALNANACRDFSLEYSLLSAPVLTLDSKERETHQQMVARVERKTNGITFFDQRCSAYDQHVETLEPGYNPLMAND